MTLEIRVCGQHSTLDRGQQGAKPLSHPYLADTAGVIEAVTDGVVVLFPAGALGRQQHVH